MKGRLVVVAAVLLIAGTASAQLPLTENFDYGTTAGSLTTFSGGTWAAFSGAGTGPVGYATSSLSLSAYPFSGVGGSATIATTGSEDVSRTWTTPHASGDIYYSALVNISSGGTGSYFLQLNANASTFRARVYARVVSGNLNFGFSNTNTATWAPDNFSLNTTYLLVVRYNAGTGAAALHVLTTYATTDTEPATPLLTATDASPLATLVAIAIRQASGGPTATIDGIRVATSWGDALPVELMNYSVE